MIVKLWVLCCLCNVVIPHECLFSCNALHKSGLPATTPLGVQSLLFKVEWPHTMQRHNFSPKSESYYTFVFLFTNMFTIKDTKPAAAFFPYYYSHLIV